MGITMRRTDYILCFLQNHRMGGKAPSPVQNPAPPNKPACTSCGSEETSEKKLEMHVEEKYIRS